MTSIYYFMQHGKKAGPGQRLGENLQKGGGKEEVRSFNVK